MADHCYDGPCFNNGTCLNLEDSHQCTCLPQYIGNNCEGNNTETRKNLIYGFNLSKGLKSWQMPLHSSRGTSILSLLQRLRYLEWYCFGSKTPKLLSFKLLIKSWSSAILHWSTYFSLFFFSVVEDFCKSQPCNNGGTCSLMGDTYKCDCQTGLTGTNCELGKITN